MNRIIDLKKFLRTDAKLEDLMQLLNSILNQILRDEKEIEKGVPLREFIQIPESLKGKVPTKTYQFHWLTTQRLMDLYSVLKKEKVPIIDYKNPVSIISKREMLEMVAQFFKTMGSEINSDYLRSMINLLDGNFRTKIYDYDDTSIERKKSSPHVERSPGTKFLYMPLLGDVNDNNLKVVKSILNPHEKYASVEDAITLVHEMIHLMYLEKYLDKSGTSSYDLSETGSILFETLFEDFVSKKYPQYAHIMDIHNYKRKQNTYLYMRDAYKALNIAKYREELGREIRYEDLECFGRPGMLNIDVPKEVIYGKDNVKKYKGKTIDYFKALRIKSLLKTFFVPMAQYHLANNDSKIITLDEDGRTKLVSNEIYVRRTSPYSLGSLFVPTILKSFYEGNREEEINKLKQYFRFYMDNKTDEALDVYGITVDTPEGIDRIHQNYMDSNRMLMEKLNWLEDKRNPSEKWRQDFIEGK